MSDPSPMIASDLGTRELVTKRPTAIVAREVSAQGTVFTVGSQVLEPTVLDRYARRGKLAQREYEAGVLLAKLFVRAIHLPSVTANYGMASGGGGGIDNGVDARKRLWSVLASAGLASTTPSEVVFTIERRGRTECENVFAGVKLAPLGHLVLAVCGYDEHAGGTRRLAQLRQGLNALADLWHLPDPSKPPRVKMRAYADPQTQISTDLPDERDFGWAIRQNKRRQRKAAGEAVASEVAGNRHSAGT